MNELKEFLAQRFQILMFDSNKEKGKEAVEKWLALYPEDAPRFETDEHEKYLGAG